MRGRIRTRLRPVDLLTRPRAQHNLGTVQKNNAKGHFHGLVVIAEGFNGLFILPDPDGGQSFHGFYNGLQSFVLSILRFSSSRVSIQTFFSEQASRFIGIGGNVDR